MLLDAELLCRLRYHALAARRAAAGPGRGPAGNRWRPVGLELVALRDYAPGDDPRQIDWTWCARRDELLTKVYAGELDRRGYVLLDCSRSMGWGEGTKFDLARQIAAALTYCGLWQGECRGLTAFAERAVGQVAWLRGVPRFAAAARFLETLCVSGDGTDLAAAAVGFVRRRQPLGELTVISDCHDPRGLGPALDALLAAGYRPRVVHVYDPAERECRTLGDVELADIESGESRQVVVTERIAAAYRRLYDEHLSGVRAACAARRVVCWQWPHDTPLETVLTTVFGP